MGADKFFNWLKAGRQRAIGAQRDRAIDRLLGG